MDATYFQLSDQLPEGKTGIFLDFRNPPFGLEFEVPANLPPGDIQRDHWAGISNRILASKRAV